MLLVKAGQPVDDFINQLLPLLEKGDLIIDGGNSNYEDTARRCKFLESQGFLFIGCGVSGGEEGARHGPSLMPGGSAAAWPLVKDIFLAIAAKADGEPCCDWVGAGGSGHYVKMVHNGIEYGDMQLICEAYHLLKGIGCPNEEMAAIFAEWNQQELSSFLIEITANILSFKDEEDSFLVERIRDAAGQKGTGKWTVNSSLDYGVPVTLIGEAVFARCLSSLKEERVTASKQLHASVRCFSGDKKEFIRNIGDALYASKLVSYAQGFMLLAKAAEAYSWKLNYGAIAMMWKGGCIIRSSFLKDIKAAFIKNPNLPNLLLDPFFISAMTKCQQGWRAVVSEAVLMGIPIPAMSSALSFYDGYRSSRLPANLLQAQRDYFGAHTYELEGAPGTYHHTNWTGTGGTTSSTAYSI